MNKINYIELNDKIVFEVIPERSDISNKGIFGKLLNISAVSYTHLDVYKRQ